MTIRHVFLVEMDVPPEATTEHGFSTVKLETILRQHTGQHDLRVWGLVDGVDAAFRKLRQLSAEIERGDSVPNMTHSAHKALSFFRDMFPASFWTFKRIGGEHPTPEERPTMAGR